MPADTTPTAYDTASCTTGCWVEYPFRDEGDSTTKIYHHIMVQTFDQYATLADDDVMTSAAQKPEGSPFADDANAYYIGDSTPQPINSKLVRFDRMFANVPADRVDPLGQYAATIPGVEHTAGVTLTAVWYATGTSKSFTNSPGPRISVDLAAARLGNYTVGDTVQLRNANEWDVNSGTTTSILRGLILSISGSTITVDTLSIPSGTTVTSIDSDNSASSYDIGLNLRDIAARTENVPSFVDVTYVRTSDPTAETLAERFLIYDSDGNITQLADNSTSPTISSILDDMQDKQIFQIEDTNIERWKGNIYAKRSIKARLPLLNVIGV